MGLNPHPWTLKAHALPTEAFFHVSGGSWGMRVQSHWTTNIFSVSSRSSDFVVDVKDTTKTIIYNKFNVWPCSLAVHFTWWDYALPFLVALGHKK